MIVPRTAMDNGDAPPGSSLAIPKTSPAPSSEPSSEYQIIVMLEAPGRNTMHSVMANTEPSLIPIMDGEAR
ncbi:hypothetical protein D3C73_859040 [compost metagenome]